MKIKFDKVDKNGNIYPDLLEEEIWKTLPCDEKYEISSYGNLRQKENKRIIKNRFLERGKIKTTFNKKQRTIDRLVAEAFIGIENKTDICIFVDGNNLAPYPRNLKIIPNYQSKGKNKQKLSDFPSLLKEWDFDKNTLNPYELASKSHLMAWWICSVCSNDFNQRINKRTVRNQGCTSTECYLRKIRDGKAKERSKKGLTILHSHLISEWADEEDPDRVALGSPKKYKWKCSKCNYIYSASPNKRNAKDAPRNCPACAHKIIVNGHGHTFGEKYENLLPTIWDYELNKKTPYEFSWNSYKHAFFKCTKHNGSYSQKICNKIRQNNILICPTCAYTESVGFNSKAEQEMINLIKSKYPNLDWNTDKVGRYFPDLKSDTLKLIIEYNGDYWHMNPLIYGPKNRVNKKSAKQIWYKDRRRKEFLERRGYDTLIIWESDWNANKDQQLKIIQETIENKLSKIK